MTVLLANLALVVLIAGRRAAAATALGRLGAGHACDDLISGAFGLFHRDLLLTVGGYWTDTVGEDFELTLRCTATCAPAPSPTASPSCPTRCAGRRCPSRCGPWAASGAAGSVGCGRGSAATGK